MNSKEYNIALEQPRIHGRFGLKGNEAMKNLGVRFPLSIFNWIENEANKRGVSKPDIVREIVQKSIEAQKR